MKGNLVSVWMITYNHEPYITKAIESILIQKTNFHFHLFIGNDCSTDNTSFICKEYAKKYPRRITLFSQKHNIGAISNGRIIYKACFESEAKYIAMCEGDDYWCDPYKLQKQVDFLEDNEEYVLCFHKVNVLKPDGALVDDFLTEVPENYENQETLARLGNYIHTPSVVFRNVLRELPNEFFLTPVGDYFLYIILSQYGKLKYIDEAMAVYRIQVGVWSKQSERYRNLKFLLTLILITKSLDTSRDYIKKILFHRIIEEFDILIEFLSEKELLQFRISDEINELMDEILLKKLNFYKNNQVQNINTLTLIKVVGNRVLNRLKK